MKTVRQNNVERSLETVTKVVECLGNPGDEKAAMVCLLADIAVSLGVVADMLIEMNKGGDTE